MTRRRTEALSLARFRELAAAYGSNLDRWPDDIRSAAERLVQETEEARAMLAGESGLEAFFEDAGVSPVPDVSDELMKRLERIPVQSPGAPRPLRLPRKVLLGPALGWAAAAAVGLWLGTVAASEETAAIEQTAAIDVTAEDSEVEELMRIAQGSFADYGELP